MRTEPAKCLTSSPKSVPSERLIRVVGGWAQTPFILRKGLPVLTGRSGRNQRGRRGHRVVLQPDESAKWISCMPTTSTARSIWISSFVNLRDNIDEASKSWKANREIAESYGLALVSYEGGQHIVPDTMDSATTQALTRSALPDPARSADG